MTTAHQPPAASDPRTDTGPASREITLLFAARAEATDAVRAADAKAATLLGFVGAALAVLVAFGAAAGAPEVRVWLYMAAAPVAGAVQQLLSAVRPRIRRNASAGIPLWATGNPAVLDAVREPRPERLVDDVVHLARLAVDKHRRISRSIVLLACAAPPAAIGLLVGAVG